MEQKFKSAGKLRLILLLLLFALTAGGCTQLFSDLESAIEAGDSIVFDEDEPSESTVDADPDSIPDYAGTDEIILNDNLPNFTEYDYENITGENFSPLDSLGRCGTAVAMLDRSMMPAGKRDDIGHIKPTGWRQKKYPGLVDSEPPYLYNRSHLIAYAMTGQNANELNLITGTRHLNAELMLPYEKQVLKYLDNSENHVLYRVSPLFCDDELLARGVEMEAYSLEDEGKGVCYHVFLYNVQEGVEIEYESGENWKKR